MKLGRVVGRVVSTVRYPGLEGVKLLLMQPVDEELQPTGGTLVDPWMMPSWPGARTSMPTRCVRPIARSRSAS